MNQKYIVRFLDSGKGRVGRSFQHGLGWSVVESAASEARKAREQEEVAALTTEAIPERSTGTSRIRIARSSRDVECDADCQTRSGLCHFSQHAIGRLELQSRAFE